MWKRNLTSPKKQALRAFAACFHLHLVGPLLDTSWPVPSLASNLQRPFLLKNVIRFPVVVTMLRRQPSPLAMCLSHRNSLRNLLDEEVTFEQYYRALSVVQERSVRLQPCSLPFLSVVGIHWSRGPPWPFAWTRDPPPEQAPRKRKSVLGCLELMR